jgi:hypothetical protein
LAARQAKAAAKATKKPTLELLLQQNQNLHRRVMALEEALKKFTDVNRTNMDAISKAFMTSDGHFSVINHILRDIVRKTVHYDADFLKWSETHSPADPYLGEAVFDLPYYYDQFNERQKKLAKIKEAEASKKKEDANDEMSVEFGGDADGKDENQGEGTAEGDGQGAGEDDGPGRNEEDTVPAVPEAANP